jgi:hypothetical protein
MLAGSSRSENRREVSFARPGLPLKIEPSACDGAGTELRQNSRSIAPICDETSGRGRARTTEYGRRLMRLLLAGLMIWSRRADGRASPVQHEVGLR